MKTSTRNSLVILFCLIPISALLISFSTSEVLKTKPINVFTSLIIIVFDALVTILFFNIEPLGDAKAKKLLENSEITKALNDIKSDDGIFKLTYEQISEEIRGRDNLTIIAGSILITASLVLLGILAQIRATQGYEKGIEILLTLVTITIYSIWLICFNLTTKLVNAIEYAYLHKIEETKEFYLHRLVFEGIKNRPWFLYARRPVWLYFFYVLTSSCIVLLLV